jgi:2-keto-4-pentenoate hydratase/2-oxohepta-3-ene-1,7-dioic acid hydratase in catechol pathway
MDQLLLVIFLPKEQFSSLENFTFELTNNSKTVQKDSSLMLWNVDELIAHVSQYFTLK